MHHPRSFNTRHMLVEGQVKTCLQEVEKMLTVVHVCPHPRLLCALYTALQAIAPTLCCGLSMTGHALNVVSQEKKRKERKGTGSGPLQSWETSGLPSSKSTSAKEGS